jgi:hypothetical protein
MTLDKKLGVTIARQIIMDKAIVKLYNQQYSVVF